MQEPLTPLQIDISAAQETLTVRWNDGHVSTYPWWYVRGFCPCAMCQGHAGGWDFVKVDRPRLAEVNEVGHYALNITWQDGHRTGIYSFEVLRQLCTCDSCRQRGGAIHPLERLNAHNQASVKPHASPD